MPNKRLFIAADISDEQRAALATLSANLQKGVHFTKSHPRWVDPAIMHLTLKFLGDTPEERIPAIKPPMASAVWAQTAFEFDLRGLGVFPSTRNPKVLWIGIHQGRKQMAALADAVERALAPFGFEPEEREFHPHLTLARIQALRGATEFMAIVNSHRESELPPTQLKHLVLYESQLTPEGPRYTPLHRWPLGPNGGATPPDGPR